jgi:hypothetical protein
MIGNPFSSRVVSGAPSSNAMENRRRSRFSLRRYPPISAESAFWKSSFPD